MTYLGGVVKSQTVSGGATATLPATSVIPVGSAMLALFSYADNTTPTFTDPAGWTLLGTLTHSTTLSTRVYSRIRQAGDTSVTVSVTGSTGKSTLIVRGDSGLDATTPYTVTGLDETSSRTVHTGQSVAAPAGSTLIEWVIDRGGPGSTAFTPSGSIVTQLENYQTGGGALSNAMGGPSGVVTGTVGADGWTGTVVTATANMWTIIGNPAVATTPVGVNFTLVHNVRAKVGKNFSLLWNTLSAVNLRYVSSVSKIGTSGTAISFNGPTGMSVNQVQFMTISYASAGTITDPVGWLVVGTPIVNGTLTTKFYTRIVQTGDNGKAYTATMGTAGKYSVVILCYQQVDTTTPVHVIQQFNETVLQAAHTLTSLTTTITGAMLLAIMLDKGSPGSTAFALTSGSTSTRREQQYDTGGGAISMTAEDSNGGVAIGTYASEVVTGTLVTNNAVGWLVAIKPATAAVTAVGVNFTIVHNIRKIVQKNFNILWNTAANNVIRMIIDDDMGLTDAGKSATITEIANDSMGLTDDMAGNRLTVRKDFNILWNTRILATVDFFIAYNIVPVAGTVGVNFNIRFNTNQLAELLWIEKDGTETTLWKEL